MEENIKVYIFTILEPNEERAAEGELLVAPFLKNAYRIFNTIILFCSETLPEIKKQINDHKSDDFTYFLFEITDCLKQNKFAANLNKKVFPYSQQLGELFKEFIPKTEKQTPDERFNFLLDKINKQGIKSLKSEEKKFLDSYSKNL